MLKSAFCFLLFGVLVLLIGCGGGAGGDSGTTGEQPLRGIWTATLDTRVQSELVADLSVQNGVISGFLRLSDGSQDYSGPVTGTQQGSSVHFEAQLGTDRFAFDSSAPLVPGQQMEGNFSFRGDMHGRVQFHHDGDESHNVAGSWAGNWQSTVTDTLKGTWSADLVQDGHNLQGHGTLLHEGHEYALNLSGTIIGRFVALAAAVGEGKASLWRGALVRTDTGFTLTGRYVGRMVPGDGIDEGNLNGDMGGGHHDSIEIRPHELILVPGGIETLHSSQANVEWSQSSEEAQPGEFVDQTADTVRFRAPLIGGHIVVTATSQRDRTIFGTAHVMVTGAFGTIGDHEFRTTLGAADRVGDGDRRSFVVEIGTTLGGLRLQTPATLEPRRFTLAPEVSTVGFRSSAGALFRANGENETAGVVAYTRISDHRVSGRFEARLRQVEHPAETVTVTGTFDVPFVMHH
jgi:hypothetical protein